MPEIVSRESNAWPPSYMKTRLSGTCPDSSDPAFSCCSSEVFSLLEHLRRSSRLPSLRLSLRKKFSGRILQRYRISFPGKGYHPQHADGQSRFLSLRSIA